MKQFRRVVIFLIVLNTVLFSDTSVPSPMLQKSMLIVKSTTDYYEAKEFAEILAKKSAIEIKRQFLYPNKKIGLTQTVEACDAQGYTYPCYTARGRYDNGIYISIEYSDAYDGFAKGYYIVVVASDETISPILLKRIQMFVADAYIKTTSVYMGCMH